MTVISIEAVIEAVTAAYPGIVVATNWGERAVFYNPGCALPKGVYLLTFKEQDGPHDTASRVSRPGIYRLNLGISKPSFVRLFGALPERPPAGGVVATGHDFQALDTLTPHPVYGWMAWIAVLNPSHETFAQLAPLIREGYDLAVQKFRAHPRWATGARLGRAQERGGRNERRQAVCVTTDVRFSSGCSSRRTPQRPRRCCASHWPRTRPAWT